MMQFYSLNDTICAIATPAIPSAIGIIRISGKNALKIFKKIIPDFSSNQIIPRTAHYTKLIINNKLIDDIIFIYYKKPSSYTGEDLIEIFPHGNPLILNKILDLLIQNNCRLGKQGEFTYRALYYNKINLLQAEAINEIITSNNIYSIENAQKILSNQAFGFISNLKGLLIKLLTLIETQLDFSDQNIDILSGEINSIFNKISSSLNDIIDNTKKKINFKNGLKVVICGKPNVGKSSFFNNILNYDRALVSNIPGTTRDFLSETININNIPLNFIDTAGIRNSKNIIEKKSIEKSKYEINIADLIIFIIDISDINNIDKEIFSLISNKNYILIINKIDLLFSDLNNINLQNILNSYNISHFINKNCFDSIIISLLKKYHTNIFFKTIEKYITTKFLSKIENNNIYFFHPRHLDIFYKMQNSIDSTYNNFNNLPLELIAENINNTLNLLSNLTGETTNDEILSNIFSNFCIGK